MFSATRSFTMLQFESTPIVMHSRIRISFKKTL